MVLCFHDWEVVEHVCGERILERAQEKLKYFVDIDKRADWRSYKIKACLKCEKVIDKITPKYEEYLRDLMLHKKQKEYEKERKNKAKKILELAKEKRINGE